MMVNEILNEENVARAAKLVEDAIKAADQIRAIFPSTTRGMMVYMYALHILRTEYPKLFDPNNVTELLAQWIAAGEPEDVTQVVPIIMEKRARMGKDPIN